MVMRWKRKPRPTGLAGVVAGPQGSSLREDGIEYASTGFISKRHGHAVEGWYWVARNDGAGVPLKNTCGNPVTDESTAKAAAMAYVKACIKAKARSASNENGQRGSGHG
jgi:hypothetical protein